MSRGTDAGTGGSPRRSPWPLLAALGLATSELGVFLGSVPLAVTGLVLLGGGSAGVVHGAGYGRSPARPMQVAGGVLLVVGGVLWVAGVPTPTPADLLVPPVDAVARRGVAGVLAGGLLVSVGTVGGRLFGSGR